MFSFFFYGTLRDADLRAIVLGGEASSATLAPAILSGYRRVRIAGRGYPALIADPRGRTDGLLASGLGETAAARISYYESDDYAVRRAEVETAAGLADGPADSRVSAWVFVPRRGRTMPLTPAPWDLALWRRRFKTGACANARAWMARLERPELVRLAAGWRARRRVPGVPQV